MWILPGGEGIQQKNPAPVAFSSQEPRSPASPELDPTRPGWRCQRPTRVPNSRHLESPVADVVWVCVGHRLLHDKNLAPASNFRESLGPRTHRNPESLDPRDTPNTYSQRLSNPPPR